jgi:hypothetical protein
MMGIINEIRATLAIADLDDNIRIFSDSKTRHFHMKALIWSLAFEFGPIGRE